MKKNQEDFGIRRILFFAVISCLFPVSAFCAPYQGKEFEFHQPDGSPITVQVWGDEFYIRAETLDGYSLVRDPVSGFTCYAEVNNDESDFISTGIPYTGQTVEELKNSGHWPSKGNGIKKGLRLKRQAVIEKANRQRQLLRRDEHGRILPAPDSGTSPAASAQAGAPAPLIGNVIGLTLLIQFPNLDANIPQADIDNYCNQVGYTGYGNNGSVRDYYYDVSNGNLTYTNYVTVYYTAQYERDYYTDESIPQGTRARELIKEALLWLDNPSGQNFNFGTLSTDGSNYMLAINAFYVGPTANNWAEGLWPHMSSMYGAFTSNEGVKSGVYQISNIGSSLTLGTFCHENGHMICGYPDLYDYGYDSAGAGNYCLMAYGGSDYNPLPPNPYLRDIKGWENITVLPPHMSGVPCSLQSNSNNSYKYLNPNNSQEFFYIDSRTQTGRNSSLPDEGLAIWHIDEYGSNNNQQMTPSLHYMVSVEQADGLFHLEYDDNYGESGDLFHAGYKDIFDDTTNPDAKWWNGNNSNMVIRQISAVGSTMSFVYDDSTIPLPPVAEAGSAGTQTNTPVTVTLAATDDGSPNPPGALTYIITSLPSHGILSDPGNGIIGSVPYSIVSFGNQVVYTPTTGYNGPDSFEFKANDGGTSPEGGDSNIAAVSINVIGMIYMANMNTNPGWSATGQWQWGVPTGQGGASHGNPDPAGGYTGSKVCGVNLSGDYSTATGGPFYLTTQVINCSGFENIHLKFYRWLNTDYQPFVSASVEVSKNASTWTTVWVNTGTEITDSSWQFLDYDISSIADNQPTVYIRWGYKITGGALAYSGWNIDDMQIIGDPISIPCTLTVNSSGASSVDIGSSTGHGGITNYTQTLTTGTDVTLTAPAGASGLTFTGWTGDVTSNNQTISFTMDGNKNVTANFIMPLDSPTLHAESHITPGLCNMISWDSVPEAKAYYAECSSDPCFLSVDYNSGWIAKTSYQFCGLNTCQEYWYRVKSGSSAWSQTSQAEFQNDTLTGTTTTSGGDVILAGGGTEAVGGSSVSGDTIGDSYFNGFLVTTETTLTQIEIYLGISTSRSIEFVVYEGGELFSDQYNQDSLIDFGQFRYWHQILHIGSHFGSPSSRQTLHDWGCMEWFGNNVLR